MCRPGLPVRGVIDPDTGLRTDSLAIPPDAIREVLANSLAHRDYSTHASCVQINIFQDRIEVTNPGVSLIPIDELETAPSTTRNPLLMAHLKELSITEQKARGIRTIKELVRDAGLKPPNFENGYGFFKATLSISPLIGDGERLWLRQFEGYKLSDSQIAVLAQLKSGAMASISNSDYRTINGMSDVGDDARARREILKLVRLGILVPRGDRRYRRYHLKENL